MKATIRTAHTDADIVMAAVQPDHTDEMNTRFVEDEIETTIHRDAPGSLLATIDDYLVNLIVAEETRQRTDIVNMTTTENTTRNQ